MDHAHLNTFLSATFLSAIALLAAIQGTYLILNKVDRQSENNAAEYKGPPVRTPGGLKKRKHTYTPRDNRPAAPEYKQSPWWHLICNPDVADPASARGKEFRQKFRISYLLFVFIVRLCKERRWASIKSRRRGLKVQNIPVELLILGVLHILGHSVKFAGVHDGSYVSATSIRVFFKHFTRKFSKEMYHVWVRLPSSAADIESVRALYAALGFPGCIGSIDCTHIGWARSPQLRRFLFVGKDGYPTLAYECVTNRLGYIMSWTSSFVGSANDITISAFDHFVSEIQNNPLFRDYEYIIYDAHGAKHTIRGLYFICDGGYNKLRIFQEGNKTATETGDHHVHVAS
jgi:Plant transposon protein